MKTPRHHSEGKPAESHSAPLCSLASASSFLASTFKHHEVKDHEMQDMSIGCLQLFLALLYNTASDASVPVPELKVLLTSIWLSFCKRVNCMFSASCSAENVLKTFRVCLCGYPASDLLASCICHLIAGCLELKGAFYS
jgi:hypothetical protein